MGGGAGLSLPRRPSVPQIVPAEVLDAGPLSRSLPCLRVGLIERPAPVGEHPRGVLALLPLQHGDSGIVQRHGNRAPVLGLPAVYPGMALFQIDLFPFQP